MFEVSEMVKRVQSSERSQRKINISKDAIRLDLGDPDFLTPSHIQEAAVKAMRDNFTHYGNPFGDEELREAICYGLKRDYGVERTPENILVTVGGLEAINVIAASYLNPGDEALVFDPDYSAYSVAVTLFGGVPVSVPLTEDFRLDLEALRSSLTERTRLVFLSNPSNPTATVQSEENLRGLIEIAIEHNVLIVVDEVYDKLIYGGIKHFSACQVEEAKRNVILVNSLSKTYAMTGWRVGYVVADTPVIRTLAGLHKTLVTCVNVPSQKASVAAIMGPQDCVQQMRIRFDERRSVVDKSLRKFERIVPKACEGAFYFFPRFIHKITSKELVNLLSEKGVLVRSGTEFGKNGEGHFRISFANSIENLKEGMTRLKKTLDELD